MEVGGLDQGESDGGDDFACGFDEEGVRVLLAWHAEGGAEAYGVCGPFGGEKVFVVTGVA